MRVLLILSAIFGIALSLSNDDDAGGQLATNLNPPIIPSGGHSNDQDFNYNAGFGAIPPQSGGQKNAGSAFGGHGGGVNTGAAVAGDSSNSVDQAVGGNPSGGNVNNGAGAGAAPNAAPVGAELDTGIMAHQNNEAPGMSGAAVAGVVAGVVAVGAVGAAVAVVALKSSASASSAA
ncbi:uncharacterized protein [Amphiura filiformis]|uniref:uncharacterized protein n=1 Tax=Amphiura filiformis TaxID=82378 RepID=UPI003B22631D